MLDHYTLFRSGENIWGDTETWGLGFLIDNIDSINTTSNLKDIIPYSHKDGISMVTDRIDDIEL